MKKALAPELEMAVLDSGSEGGSRGRVGLQLGLIRAESVKTVIKLILGTPGCQVGFAVRLVRKSFRPLFVVLPGPEGCARVLVETWPKFFARQFLIVWFSLNPQPWVDHKVPQCHLLRMASSGWLMRRLASGGGIKGVESVAVAAAYKLEREAFLSVVKRGFIYSYCIVVVAANWLRAAPLFVAAAARLSK